MRLIAAFTTSQVAHDRGVTITYPAMKVQFRCPECGAACAVRREHERDAEETGQCVCATWYWVNWVRGEIKQQ